MFDDDINEGSIEENDIDYGHEAQFLFNTFSSNKIFL